MVFDPLSLPHVSLNAHVVFFSRCFVFCVRFWSGNFDEAEALFREALGINERAHGFKHPEVASCLNSLAALLQVNALGNAQAHRHAEREREREREREV